MCVALFSTIFIHEILTIASKDCLKPKKITDENLQKRYNRQQLCDLFTKIKKQTKFLIDQPNMIENNKINEMHYLTYCKSVISYNELCDIEIDSTYHKLIKNKLDEFLKLLEYDYVGHVKNSKSQKECVDELEKVRDQMEKLLTIKLIQTNKCVYRFFREQIRKINCLIIKQCNK